MPRLPITDFRGGVNTTFSTETLSLNELRLAQNGRLNTVLGGVSLRGGTRRFHDTAVESGASVMGGYDYKAAPGGRQTVVIAGGKLHYKLDAASDFTTVTPMSGSFSSTNRPVFAPFTHGGQTFLYIADGNLWQWDGSALTLCTGTNDAPSATWIRVYKSRLFALDGSKTLYWSTVNDPTEWRSIAPNNGGQAFVDTYDDDPLVALATTGSSLLLIKRNSVARFTGTSRDNIQIDAESQGVSRDVGCIAAHTVVEFGPYVFFLSERGPYVATEAGVSEVGMQLGATWRAANGAAIGGAVAVYHHSMREVLLAIPGATESSTVNDRIWVFNEDTQSWCGPWTGAASNAFANFSACCLFQWEDTDGTDTYMVGGYDGLVRRGEIGTGDNQTRAGSTGTSYPFVVEFESVFGDPSVMKIAEGSQEVSIRKVGTAQLRMVSSGELGPTQNLLVSNTSLLVPTPLRWRPSWRGRRLALRATVSQPTGPIELLGFVLNIVFGRSQV